MKRTFVIALSILLAPLAYLAFAWPQLGDRVPVHFGANGMPDRYGDKSELLFSVGFLSVIGLFTYFLLANIHKIDPKRSAAQSQETLQKLALATTLLMGLIGLMIVRSAITGQISGQIIFTILGLFLAYLGNLMHSVKPNYFVGFRLPWTLENEENWRKTHRMGSKIWVLGGVCIAVSSLFLPAPYLVGFLLAAVLLMSLAPAVYSYNLFQKERSSKR